LLEYLREKPTAYIEEMADFLLDEFDVLPSETTTYRTLERVKWTRKVASKHAKERSEALREVFWLISREWDPSQVVAIDESAANERTVDRKRGWRLINELDEVVESHRVEVHSSMENCLDDIRAAYEDSIKKFQDEAGRSRNMWKTICS
jgi:translation initiation factor 2 alpha subunit (eIF-2alpha)